MELFEDPQVLEYVKEWNSDYISSTGVNFNLAYKYLFRRNLGFTVGLSYGFNQVSYTNFSDESTLTATESFPLVSANLAFLYEHRPQYDAVFSTSLGLAVYNCIRDFRTEVKSDGRSISEFNYPFLGYCKDFLVL